MGDIIGMVVGRVISISASEVREMDVATDTMPYARWHEYSKYLAAASGEHYKLLATIASKFVDGRFVDVGTFLGHSALALSVGHEALGNRVFSYDNKDSKDSNHNTESIKSHAGIELRVRDEIGSDDVVREIASIAADLILLDVSPHDGKFERDFVAGLVRHGYKGLLLLDDIHLNPEMTAFWQWIPAERKLDLTEIGHWSGTGLVAFDPEHTIDVVVE